MVDSFGRSASSTVILSLEDVTSNSHSSSHGLHFPSVYFNVGGLVELSSLPSLQYFLTKSPFASKSESGVFHDRHQHRDPYFPYFQQA